MSATVRQLHPLETTPARGGQSLAADDGSRAIRDGEGEEQRLAVVDRDEKVLFEFFPAEGRSVVYVPTGDLTLRAPAGSIELEAGEGVRLRGDRVELLGEQVELRGDRLESSFRRVRETVDVLETNAGRVVERARETFREVEELAQTRAGHIRHVASEAFHVLATRTQLKARRALKLKGDTIHLG